MKVIDDIIYQPKGSILLEFDIKEDVELLKAVVARLVCELSVRDLPKELRSEDFLTAVDNTADECWDIASEILEILERVQKHKEEGCQK